MKCFRVRGSYEATMPMITPNDGWDALPQRPTYVYARKGRPRWIIGALSGFFVCAALAATTWAFRPAPLGAGTKAVKTRPAPPASHFRQRTRIAAPVTKEPNLLVVQNPTDDQLLTACDDFSYEWMFYPSSPKTLADRMLIMRRYRAVVSKASVPVAIPQPGTTQETDAVSLACMAQQRLNAAERNAAAHRLYGGY